jgi:hypothetical protein
VKLAAIAGAAAALAVLASGCTSDGSRSLPTGQPSVKQSSSGADRPLPLPSGTSELDICQALPSETMSQLLDVTVSKTGAGAAGGNLLGECDYTAAAPPSASASTAAPPISLVYVSGRPNTDYADLVKQYSAGNTTIQLAERTLPATFSPTAGLLVRVPGSDYFLQIAVEDAAHDVQQAPAERIARYYISGQ